MRPGKSRLPHVRATVTTENPLVHLRLQIPTGINTDSNQIAEGLNRFLDRVIHQGITAKHGHSSSHPSGCETLENLGLSLGEVFSRLNRLCHTPVMIESGNSRRGWIVGGIVTAIFLGLALWFLRPAYRGFKERRSLSQAQAFMASGDFRSALLSLRQTLVLNPNNLTAAKIMADVATQTQSPSALVWWQRVVEIEPTVANQALLASAALRIESPPYSVANKSIESLSAGAATNVIYHLLAAQLALKMNRGAIVEQHLEAALRLEPTNKTHRINLATLRLNAPTPGVAAAARAELNDWVNDEAWRTTVLRSLAADALGHTNGASALSYTSQLWAMTNATFGDRLQHLAAVRLARPTDLAALLEREQERCGTNLIEIAQLAAWQNQFDQARVTLKWMERLEPRSRSTPPIALVEADARMVLHEWAELEAALTEQKWEEQEFLRLAYLARAMREQGRTTLFRANWERAVGATFARGQNAGILAQVALSWRWHEEATDLLWQAVRRWEREDWPLQSLMSIYVSTGNSDGLYRVYEMVYSRHPDALPAKNNFVMIGLLLQRDGERMLQLASELNEAGGTNGIFASTYAFALHRNGRTAEGLEVINRLSEVERHRDEVKPYQALLMIAMGDKSAPAAELRLAADRSSLPEERELFRAALR